MRLLLRSRSTLTVAGLLASLGLFLSACGSRESGPPEIVFAAGQDPSGATERLVERFNREHPEWRARFQPMPSSSDLQHDAYVTYLGAGDDRIDLYALDVVWTSEFAGGNWLAPVGEGEVDRGDFLDAPLRSASFGGRLVAVPWFTDAGVLFYRSDLLEENKLSPPQTWQELIDDVRVVRGAGAPDLAGYAWQGARYEGLVCNFLEVLWGRGGSLDRGELVERPAEAERRIAETLRFMRGLLAEDTGGKGAGGAAPISPEGVLTWREEESRRLFTSGGALFLRNWPYVWSLAQEKDSPVAGRVGLALLPHAAGSAGASVLGGWNIARSRFSAHPEGARALLRFLTSAAAMKERAVEGGYLPARRSVYRDGEVLSACPHFERLEKVVEAARNRPASRQYARLSDLVQRRVHETLTGEEEPEHAAAALVRELPALLEGDDHAPPAGEGGAGES